MIAKLILAAMNYRWAVLLAAVAIMAAGVQAFRVLPIDAYPDISGQTVTITATYPGRAPEEVERQVVVPLEIALRGVPRATTIRSRAIFGLAVVQVSFEEGVESYWARQRILERIGDAAVPDVVKPQLQPLVNGYGEIYRYELVSDGTTDLMELRTLNDWVVVPRLLRVPGMGDVSIFGGPVKQFTVTFVPSSLEHYGLSLNDVVDAIKSNNNTSGGSVINRGSMSFVVRGTGSLQEVSQIENVFLKSVGGTPIYVKDVGNVGLDARTPSGIYSKDDTDDSVEGVVIMRRGENPSIMLARVKEVIQELNEEILPPGVKILPFYDRGFLVKNTLETVSHSVLLGITLVVLVLLLFLGRPAMAAMVAVTIPFSLLFALCLMFATGIPIGLLSIGAIDFGIIVDGAVIMAEHVARRLGEAKHRGEKVNVFETVFKAACEVERAVFFSVLMIVVAYLPLLSLSSIEGLLFRPMAITMVYALGGALIFALFVVPVLAVIIFRNGYEEWENPLLFVVKPLYRLSLRGLLLFRWLTLALVLIGGVYVVLRVAPKVGFEFLPYMDEGTIWVRANFPEGTSLQQTAAFGKRLREVVAEFPDIKYVSVQSGRNDSNTDPFPPSRMELMIGPQPQRSWKEFTAKQEMIQALRKRFKEEFPTTRFSFTQPIIDTVTEESNGTSASLAVEISGPDPLVLRALGEQAATLLRGVRGGTDVAIEQEGPQPQLVIEPDRARCARYNVRIDDVSRVINTALGGEPIGTLYEGDRRFDIVAKFDRSVAGSPQAIGRLPVFTADGVRVPLAQVATIEVIDGQTLIARQDSRRRVTVRCDIVGRDEGGYVAEAQKRFDETLKAKVPDGYKVAWVGMFENLQRAKNHFLYVIPVTVVMIFGLLVMTFGCFRAASLLLLAVPFGFAGGIIALQVRGMNLNVSTGVGFAALFGVSIMNGVLMVRGINYLRLLGYPLDAAILQGSTDCLRPILLASLVAILGLLPASLATGLGSDVQRPLATVIVWGLFSSTVMTLLMVPVLYRVFVPRVAAESAHH